VWGVVILALLVVLVLSSFLPHNSAKSLTYTTFLNDGKAKQVQSANVDNSTGTITGKLSNGTSYTVSGPNPVIPADITQLQSDGVDVTFSTPSNFVSTWLPYLFFFLLFGG